MTGQSTFFVELAETAAMLHKATSRCVCVIELRSSVGQQATAA